MKKNLLYDETILYFSPYQFVLRPAQCLTTKKVFYIGIPSYQVYLVGSVDTQNVTRFLVDRLKGELLAVDSGIGGLENCR